MPLTVGFITNQLSIRGTETVLWAYAHYNETILGNRSIIFVKDKDKQTTLDTSIDATKWFTDRFKEIHYCSPDHMEDLMIKLSIDVCFIELAGVQSDWVPTRVPSVLHCVFDALLKGTISTGISECVARGRIPVLPNIMPMDDTMDDMREELDIPKDAIVFGRYGGYGQFSIKYAHDVVREVSSRNPNIYFLFMNTEPFMEPSKNVIFLEGSRNLYKKRKFINTCDAMLHAREDGETFGAAIGEFALCNKNIITCQYQIDHNQDQHLKILGDQCISYDNQDHLTHILENFPMYKKNMEENGYFNYTPEEVIPLFNMFINTAIKKAKS